MIVNTYQMLFRIRIKHSYFKNGICSCIRVQPDAVTGKLFSRFGMIMTNTEDGFMLSADFRSAIGNWLNYIETATGRAYFVFMLTTSYPAFSIITQLPIDKAGQMIYDTQSALNIHEDNGMLLYGSLSAESSAGYLGNLKVHFSDIVKQQTREGCAVFSVCYDARSTQWQYYLISRNQFPLYNLSITGKAGIHFSNPVRTVIKGGQQALLFSSDTLIPLSEMPLYSFNLIFNPEPGSSRCAGRLMYKGLPNPDLRYFGLVRVNAEVQVSSPMYVYV